MSIFYLNGSNDLATVPISTIYIRLLVKQLFSLGKGTTITLINDKFICFLDFIIRLRHSYEHKEEASFLYVLSA